MSQAGIVSVKKSNPTIPTMFVTNSGTAVPIANTLDILGTTVAAHSIPLETTGATNVVTVVAQYASAAASSIAANAGFASFNSADFTVDGNGYVTFSGSGAMTQFTMDDSTVVIPSAGNVNLISTQVSTNNVHGIQTTSSPNLGNNAIIELTNRISATATTTDGTTPVTVYSFALSGSPAVYNFDVRIAVLNVTDNLGAGYQSFRIVRTNGTTATAISASPGVVGEESTMDGILVANGQTGNNITLTVTGLTGKTIHYYVLTTYVVVS